MQRDTLLLVLFIPVVLICTIFGYTQNIPWFTMFIVWGVSWFTILSTTVFVYWVNGWK